MLHSRLEARGCEVEFVTDLNGSTDRQGSLRTLQAALAGGELVQWEPRLQFLGAVKLYSYRG